MSMDGPKGAQLVSRFVPKSKHPEKYIHGGMRSAAYLALLLWLFGWLVVGWIGSAIGFVLMIVFSVLARRWRCGVCKNPIDGRDVAICPHCRADYR